MLDPVVEPLMTRMLAFSSADCPELAQSLLQRKRARDAVQAGERVSELCRGVEQE